VGERVPNGQGVKITIEFLGFPTIYDLFPEGSHGFALPGDRIPQIVEELIARYGLRVRESLFEHGTKCLDPAIQVMVNGKLIPPEQIHEWKIREGDRVTFMKLLAGG
jgi:sulfur carrier protein ThiS